MIATALFWTCCLAAVGGAAGAAGVRNLFHAALLLGLSLTGVAGLYLFLGAAYLACVQLIVYVGGILVLILFATLFSADLMGRVQRAAWWQRMGGLLAAALAAAVAGRLAQTALHEVSSLEPTRSAATPGPDAISGPGQTLGGLLLTEWLVPFLVAGVLLTIVLVAAVATVRRYRRGGAEEAHG